MLDNVPCDVKGKITTDFKDNSLWSFLQLSVIQEFASRFLPVKHFYQMRIVLQRGKSDRKKPRKISFFWVLFSLIENDSSQL